MRAKLLDLARARREAFDYVLNRYAVERLLHRLSCSAHRDDFVLKGATLLRIWSIGSYRPTRDVDFLGRGSSDLDDVATKLRELCDVAVPDDGITFDASSVAATRIKDDDEYEGVRVQLEATIAGARIPVQIDVGFGDAVHPVDDHYPVLLSGSPTPRIRVYPREAVVAEKVQAMVDLGLANSRMKDFYDVDHLARTFAFAGPALLDAIRATFERRRTPVPDRAPIALTATFSNDSSKQMQWGAFLKRAAIPGGTLADVVESISSFVLPLFVASHGGPEPDAWPPGGPWGHR